MAETDYSDIVCGWLVVMHTYLYCTAFNCHCHTAGVRGSRLERVAVLRHGLFNDIRLQASLKNVPLCEVPVLTATLLRSRRDVFDLVQCSLEAVRSIRHSNNIRAMMMMMMMIKMMMILFLWRAIERRHTVAGTVASPRSLRRHWASSGPTLRTQLRRRLRIAASRRRRFRFRWLRLRLRHTVARHSRVAGARRRRGLAVRPATANARNTCKYRSFVFFW